uniref:Uncharacterized protein n=1 Tax=Rhizophora mucronata TaxID=61149 RepID=A0A2P2NQ69_RHIMU
MDPAIKEGAETSEEDQSVLSNSSVWFLC